MAHQRTWPEKGNNSPMLVIPAIDLRGGKCVRLYKGRYEDETVYSDDPGSQAKQFEDDGAELIHVVDLDGARAGRPSNEKAIREIIKSISIPIELGGGIRDMDTIKATLDMGVGRVILGTVAYSNPDLVIEAAERFPDSIVVGIDAHDGKTIAVKGWAEDTGMSAIELAKKFEPYPIVAVIYTDISRDGTLKGPNVEAMSEMADAVSTNVIASGGVSSIDDIIKLMSTPVAGVITGKALYEGKLSLKEAIAKVKIGDCP